MVAPLSLYKLAVFLPRNTDLRVLAEAVPAGARQGYMHIEQDHSGGIYQIIYT